MACQDRIAGRVEDAAHATDIAAGQIALADVDDRQRAADGGAVGQAQPGAVAAAVQLAKACTSGPLLASTTLIPRLSADAHAVEARLAASPG